MSEQHARRPDVVCVGETMVLLVPDPPRPPELAATFRREIGGAESNVAIHLSRLGRTVCWHSAVGDDAFGRFVRSRIVEEGVGFDCVRVAPGHRTGLYVKELRADGTSVAYYRDGSAATTLGPQDLAALRSHRPRIVHSTGITAVLSRSTHALVSELMHAQRTESLCSFDVNYRPSLHDEHAGEILLQLARHADIVFCGLDEAQALWDVHDADQVRALLADVPTLIVKNGAEGATGFQYGETWHQPAPRVHVVEPVGAGDAFAAGVLSGILDAVGLPASLERGARLAGQALGVHGDLPPRDDRDEPADAVTTTARDHEASNDPSGDHRRVSAR